MPDVAKDTAMEPSTSASLSSTPSQLFSQLPDELWALVLSKFTWRGAWQQAKVLLCWRPGAAQALAAQPQLLAQLLSARYQTGSASSALHCAAERGRADVLGYLLTGRQHGVEVMVLTARSAARSGQASTLALLLKHIRANEGESAVQEAMDDAMYWAAADGHVHIVQQLLDQGASISHDALHRVAECGHHIVLRVLVAGGADLAAHGEGMLRTAAYYGRTQAAMVLLDAGVDANTVDVHFMAVLGYADMLQVLLQRGAQLSNAQEEACIQVAVRAGSPSIVKMLLGRRAQ